MLKKKKPTRPKHSPPPVHIADILLAAPRVPHFMAPGRENDMIVPRATSARSRSGESPQRHARLKRWQLQDAKARLSRLVKDVGSKGPQIITLHGQDVAAVIPIADLPHVIAASQSTDNQKGAILEMLQRCPYPLSDLDLARDQTPISSKSIFED